MNNDYDDELESGKPRRSRRRPDSSGNGGDSSSRYTARKEEEPPRRSASRKEEYLDDDFPQDTDYDDIGSGDGLDSDDDFFFGESEKPRRTASANRDDSYRRTGSGTGRATTDRTITDRTTTDRTTTDRSASSSRNRETGKSTKAQSSTRRTESSRNTATNGRTASSIRAAQKEKTSRIRKIVLLVLAECLTLFCIFSYAYAARLSGLIQRPNDFSQKDIENTDLDIDTIETMKGYWTIAVFGVDSRSNNVSKGTNADVNMICNINMDTGEIKLVSVFRDSYLNVNDNNSYNKINQAYAQGGPQQAIKALNKNMDLNITDYVTFSWKAVADAINILGGVDLEISKAEFYYINSFITETVKVTGIPSVHLKKAGMNHLDGVQAVAYGRLRLMDTDFARTERQRKIIQLAFDKAKKADIGVLNNLMVTIFPQVSTMIDAKDMSKMVFDPGKYYIGETTGFPSARGDANMGKKGACVIPQTLESNVIELHKFLFGEEAYTPSNTVKTISKKIAADTGMYKEAAPIDKVPTDGGYIPKPTTAPKETTSSETKETKETDETKETKESTSGIRPGETLESETDEDGNPIYPGTKPTRPSTSPTESSSATRPSTNPTRPSETSPSTTTPGGTKPTTSPTKPSGTKPEATTSPGDNGPGNTPTTAPPATEAPTIPPAPIETSGSGGSSGGPGMSTGNDTGVVVGTPGP